MCYVNEMNVPAAGGHEALRAAVLPQVPTNGHKPVVHCCSPREVPFKEHPSLGVLRLLTAKPQSAAHSREERAGGNSAGLGAETLGGPVDRHIWEDSFIPSSATFNNGLPLTCKMDSGR